MKQLIDRRPVYYRKEQRIRAHWLAPLLARVAESASQATWPRLRRQLNHINLPAHPRLGPLTSGYPA